MGLDMCMYVSKYEFCDSPQNIKTFYPKELQKIGERLNKYDSLAIETQYKVAYWRKAWPIHNWISENCLDNEYENCNSVSLSSEDIERLIKTCKEVLKDHSKASELLPDDYDEYDEWYFKQLEQTVEQLEPVIKLIKCGHDEYSFVYWAWW